MLLFCSIAGSAQTVFPKGFRQIKDDDACGENDVYTNRRYSFLDHKIFRPYDNYIWNDEAYCRFASGYFGFPLHPTKDSLLWGTGRKDSLYSYVVVDWGGEAYELISYHNDSGFSMYSKWLITTIRNYRKKGKHFIFPMH